MALTVYRGQLLSPETMANITLYFRDKALWTKVQSIAKHQRISASALVEGLVKEYAAIYTEPPICRTCGQVVPQEHILND